MNIIGINGYIGSGKDTVGKIIQFLTSDPEGQKFEDFKKETDWWWVEDRTSWKIKKYAGKLKQIASILTGIPVEKFEDQEFKKNVLDPQWTKWGVRVLPDDSHEGSYIIKYFATEQEADHYIQNSEKEIETINTDLKDRGIGGFAARYLVKELIILTVRQFLQLLGTEAMRDVIHPNTWVNALFADYVPSYQWGKKDDSHRLPNWIITDTRFENEAQAIKDRRGIVIRVNRDWELRKNGEYIEPDFIPHSSETGLDSWTFDHIIENNSGMDDLVEAVRVMLKYYEII